MVAALAVLLLVAGVTGVTLAGRHSKGAAVLSGSAAAPASKPSAVITTAGPQVTALGDDLVLRPGATLVKRINASLDGSATGEAIVASRVDVTGGCPRWYLDVYAFVAGKGGFADVFDAGSGPAQLLPPPTNTDAGCFPRVDLLDVRTFAGGDEPLAVATIPQADGRTRLVALSMSAGAGTPLVNYDAFIPSGATVRVVGSPSTVEVTQSAFAPPVAGVYDPARQGAVGIYREQLAGQGTRLSVTAHDFVPACTAGTLGSRAEVQGSRWLRIDCSGSGGNARPSSPSSLVRSTSRRRRVGRPCRLGIVWP